jgi:hypothetical protein
MNSTKVIISKFGKAHKVFQEIRELARLYPTTTLGQLSAAGSN